jgi:hypothetical protein
MVEATGIEPASDGCEPTALPLSYAPYVEAAVGLEPTLCCLRNSCSVAIELHGLVLPARVDLAPPHVGNVVLSLELRELRTPPGYRSGNRLAFLAGREDCDSPSSGFGDRHSLRI